MTDVSQQPATPVVPSARPRPTPGIVVFAAVLAAIAAITVWRVVHDERPHAETGRLYSAEDSLRGTRTTSLIGPFGWLQIRATAALDDVDHDTAIRTMQPPEDGSFVGIELTFLDDGPDGPTEVFGATTDGNRPELTVVADGRRYPLLGPAGEYRAITPGRWYLGVAGKPARLVLEADAGGHSQSVNLRDGTRDAREFAPLYPRTRFTPRDCSAPVLDGGYRVDNGVASCRVIALVRTPYVGRKGWAPRGSVWTAVRLAVSIPDGYARAGAGGRISRYDTSGPVETTASLDGVAGTSTSARYRDPEPTFVFLTPASPAPQRLVLRTKPGLYPNSISRSEGAYDAPELTITWQAGL